MQSASRSSDDSPGARAKSSKLRGVKRPLLENKARSEPKDEVVIDVSDPAGQDTPEQTQAEVVVDLPEIVGKCSSSRSSFCIRSFLSCLSCLFSYMPLDLLPTS